MKLVYLMHTRINSLNTELNPICHLPALLGSHYILHISRIGVNGIVSLLQFLQPLQKTVSTRHQRNTVFWTPYQTARDPCTMILTPSV